VNAHCCRSNNAAVLLHDLDGRDLFNSHSTLTIRSLGTMISAFSRPACPGFCIILDLAEWRAAAWVWADNVMVT
jgi:hypothetical protein